ncbi:acyltransferase family protein [Corynebacterium pyruviciproducens]
MFALHSLVFLQVYPFHKSALFATIHRFIPMQLGSTGGTFFFILSGFLIYWSNSHIRTGTEVRHYLLRRVTKINPTHLLALVLFVVPSATFTAHGVKLVLDFSRLALWLLNALLLHTWRPAWATLGGMNTPSWSLVSEMLFYLSLPLFVPLFRRIRGRGNWVGRTEFPIGYGATKVIAEGCVAPTDHIRGRGGHLWWYQPNTAEEIWAFLRVQHRQTCRLGTKT